MGPGTVRVSYNDVDLKNSSNDAQKFAIGYVYDLSKRTALYGTLAHVKNKGAASFGATPSGLSFTQAAGKNANDIAKALKVSANYVYYVRWKAKQDAKPAPTTVKELVERWNTALDVPPAPKPEAVNHPAHYTTGIETIDSTSTAEPMDDMSPPEECIKPHMIGPNAMRIPITTRTLPRESDGDDPGGDDGDR